MMSVGLLVIPLIGAVIVALAPTRRAKWIALAASGLTFLVSIVFAVQFAHWSDGGFSPPVGMPWLEAVGVDLELGADAVSMVLVLLTTLIMPLCVAGSFTAITQRVKEYYGWMLIIQTAMTGVFLIGTLGAQASLGVSSGQDKVQDKTTKSSYYPLTTDAAWSIGTPPTRARQRRVERCGYARRRAASHKHPGPLGGEVE